MVRQKWPQPTICAKTIYQYGPRPNRDKESVLKLTSFNGAGGSVPMKTNPHEKQWQITVGP